MTDAQIIAIAITVLAVLAGSVSTHVCLGDLNTSVGRHLDDMKDVLLAGMNGGFEYANNSFQRAGFERIDPKLDTIISMISRLDARLTKLEGRID
jgi:hypothetical protein